MEGISELVRPMNPRNLPKHTNAVSKYGDEVGANMRHGGVGIGKQDLDQGLVS